MRTAKTVLTLLSFSLLLFSLDASALLVKKPIRSSLVGVTVKVANAPVLPKDFWLGQNYPNPLNLETVIEYGLPNDCQVKLTIYNILGQRVKTLINGFQKAGYKRIVWNGRDDSGKEVSSGIYLYKIDAGRHSDVKKMVIVK